MELILGDILLVGVKNPSVGIALRKLEGENGI